MELLTPQKVTVLVYFMSSNLKPKNNIIGAINTAPKISEG